MGERSKSFLYVESKYRFVWPRNICQRRNSWSVGVTISSSLLHGWFRVNSQLICLKFCEWKRNAENTRDILICVKYSLVVSAILLLGQLEIEIIKSLHAELLCGQVPLKKYWKYLARNIVKLHREKYWRRLTSWWVGGNQCRFSRTADSRPSLARDTRNLTQTQAVKYYHHHCPPGKRKYEID